MRTDTATAAALLLAVAVLFLPDAGVDASQGVPQVADRRSVPQSPLAELRHKRRVHLVATSLPVGVLDARQAEDEAAYARTVIADVSNSDAMRMRRVPDAYEDLDKQLKKYAKRYRSLELVERPEDADFLLIWYEVSRLRLGDCFECFYKPGNYSVGLVVIVTMGSAEEPGPHVVVQTEKPLLMAKDFIKGFIRELKIVRGEK